MFYAIASFYICAALVLAVGLVALVAFLFARDAVNFIKGVTMSNKSLHDYFLGNWPWKPVSFFILACFAFVGIFMRG